ncbi:MAG: PQQ-binding-like beta-propeller repeat protein [Verrucomicrobiales bacterium]
MILAATGGFASAVAFCLSGCEGEGGGGEKESVAEPEKTETVSDWPLFRGDPEMQGKSAEALEPPLEMAWSFEPPVEEGRRRAPIDASPVVANGQVFVGTQEGVFHCLNLETGEPVWSFEPEGPVSAPAAARGGRVYFGDTYGFVYALDAASGEEIWRFETDGKIEGGINTVGSGTEEGRIFVGSHDYFIYCLDADSGEVLWKHETGNYVVATPSIIDSGGEQAVAFGGCDGLLYIIPTDGEGEKREIEIGSYIANTSAIRDGICYLAHNGGEIVAIEVDSGEVVWRVDTGVEYTASPAVDAQNVYVAGPDKRLVAFDRVRGEEKWVFLARRSLDSSPVVSGGVVWQAGMDGRLYAVDLEAGSERWNYELGTQIKASPAVSRGTLVICGEDGVVYGFAK